MSNSSVDEEIVKLIQEINEIEGEIVEARTQESRFTLAAFKDEYTAKAKILEDQLERKMRLLRILKA